MENFKLWSCACRQRRRGYPTWQMRGMAGILTVTLSPPKQGTLQLQTAHHRGIRAGWALDLLQMSLQLVGEPQE